MLQQEYVTLSCSSGGVGSACASGGGLASISVTLLVTLTSLLGVAKGGASSAGLIWLDGDFTAGEKVRMME